jgi:hypothetical protein
MGADGLIGRLFFAQIAYWKGAALAARAGLTSLQAPMARSAIGCY